MPPDEFRESILLPVDEGTSFQECVQRWQTQDFHASKKKTFNAVMTVLQNYGYVIQTADYNTGFITGKSPTQGGGWGNQQSTLSVTAFITSTKKKGKKYTHVRLSFVKHTVTHQHRMSYTDSSQILSTSLYTKTFNAIRQQVFVAGAL